MTSQQYPNSFGNGAADTTLSGNITAGAVSLTVATVPPGVTAAPFTIGIDTAGVREWIYVGAISGTVWSSLIRGFGGSTPAAHSTGNDIRLELTGDDIIALLTGRTHTPDELLVNGDLALIKPLTPTTITVSQNNYAPIGFSGSSHLRLEVSSALNITGFGAPSEDGRWLVVINKGATNSITFKNEDTGSLAGNRFHIAQDFALDPGHATIFIYDLGLSRWLLAAGSVDDDSTLVAKSLFTTKGDILVATAADTPLAFPVGLTDGQALLVDSTQTQGIRWGSVASNLADLLDVLLTSVANKQLLQYDLGSAKWINVTPENIGHYEIIVSGSGPPPDPVTNMSGTDYVYGWVI